jgi:hypothetical protein
LQVIFYSAAPREIDAVAASTRLVLAAPLKITQIAREDRWGKLAQSKSSTK